MEDASIGGPNRELHVGIPQGFGRSTSLVIEQAHKRQQAEKRRQREIAMDYSYSDDDDHLQVSPKRARVTPPSQTPRTDLTDSPSRQTYVSTLAGNIQLKHYEHVDLPRNLETAFKEDVIDWLDAYKAYARRVDQQAGMPDPPELFINQHVLKTSRTHMELGNAKGMELFSKLTQRT